MTYHAAVWIDHQEAKIFHLTTQDVEKDAVHNSVPNHHVHRKADHLGRWPGTGPHRTDAFSRKISSGHCGQCVGQPADGPSH